MVTSTEGVDGEQASEKVREVESDADCPASQSCNDVHFMDEDGRTGGLLGRGCE